MPHNMGHKTISDGRTLERAERWTCKVWNACSFDTAEKAEAHETMCANSLDTKWTWGVCKFKFRVIY